MTWAAPTEQPGGYSTQYRKQGDTGWTDYVGSIANRTFTISNLEPGAIYEARVKSIYTNEPRPWSDTGSGRANRAPAASSAPFLGGTFSVGSTVDYRETGSGAIGVLFADADSDTLTYSAAAQHPALLGVSLSGAAGQAHLRVTLLNQGSSKVNITATDAYGGSVTRSVTITVTAETSRSVAENAAAGTNVGVPVTGTPYDDGDEETDDALTYSLAGEASTSGAFVIDPASGQISVSQGASLDYETKDSYTGQVRYTVGGHNAAISVSLKVTDVAPGQARRAHGDAHGVQRAVEPGARRQLDGRRGQRHDHHRLRGAVPQEGRPGRGGRGLDGLQRRPGRDGDQPHPGGPGGGRDLRGPGAGGQQRRERRRLVGCRLRAGQPPPQIRRSIPECAADARSPSGRP